jgi:fused signal recognition particle receptor
MFGFIKKSLNKTVEAIKTVAPTKKITFTKDELEDILLEADVEYELVEIILREIYQEEVTREILRSKLLATLRYAEYKEPEFIPPFVELIVGVNGAGKTTTIAKLAKRYKDEGKSVLLGAGDTFRAAAIEQLTLWAQKLDIPIVSSKQGHDSSAVAYDAIDSARAKNIDHVIIDTAGRLHTQTNLANELKKIKRICNKAHPSSPHRTLLIIDGTQGNSAITQAQAFNEMIGIDGIIITKLDGTAKGGSIFSIAYALELPILYVGTGEKPENLTPFDKFEFVDGLLDALFVEEAKEESQDSSKEEIVEQESVQEEQEPQEEIQEVQEEEQTKSVDETTDKEETATEEKEEEKIDEAASQKEEALEKFLIDERLILLKMLSDDVAFVNYSNTPVDTEIIYKDGKWQYKK